MKKILSVLLTVAMLITLLPAMSAFADADDSIVYEAADIACKAGDTITVGLEFKSGFGELEDVAFDIGYDPQYLSYVSKSATSISGKYVAIVTDETDGLVEGSNLNNLFIPITSDTDDFVSVEVGEKLLTLQFTVKSDIADYVETPISFKLNKDSYQYLDHDTYDPIEVGDRVVLNGCTVKIGTPSTDTPPTPSGKKEITNIVTKDTTMAGYVTKGTAVYKVVPASKTDAYDVSAKKYDTKEEAQAQIDKADAYLAGLGLGEHASRGSNIWSTYPQVNGTSIDNPMQIISSNTIADVINGESYLIKAQKGHSVTLLKDSDEKVTGISNQNMLGTDEEYVKFDVNASGTMYVVETNGYGYPGGIAAGYEKMSGTIGGCAAYAKHFDIGDASSITVTVPAQGLSDETIRAKMNAGGRIPNTQGYIFVFDDETTAEINNVKTEIGGTAAVVNCESGTYEYTINTMPYTGKVDLEIGKKTSAQKITGDTSVELVAGNGEANFTVTSGDGSASQDYKIIFACEPYKIVSPTKGAGASWIAGIYGPAAEKKGINYIAVENADVANTFVYSDRDNKAYGSANLQGATVIRTPKNEAPSNYTNVEVFDENGKSGSNITFTKTIEGKEPQTLTGRVDGAFDGEAGRENKSGFRLVKASSVSNAFFSGKYDGTDGNWWVTFIPTSDCTVVIGDKVGMGYPNLDRTLWKNNTNYNYSQGANHSYVRHFKAGEVVQIPNYGVSGTLADKTKITYEYYDNTGTKVKAESTVGADYKCWEDLTFAIVWDAKAVDNNASYIKIDDVLIKDFKADTLDYTYEIPYGTESVKLTAAAADSIAKIEGGEGTFKAGETATIKITSGNGTEKTYTVTFTQAAPPTSTDATLKTITVNGVAIADFAADKYSYDVTIPYGEAVDIKWTLSDEKASAALTNEGNVYKITVTAEDKTTVLEYVINIASDVKKNELKTSAIGGGSILATYGSVTEEEWGSAKTESFVTGTEITLKAVAGEGEEFLYWKDNQTSRVVSYFNEYSFIIGTGRDLSAVFKTTGSYSVKFMDMNYKVVGEGVSTDTITVPKNPYLMGYTFGGWKIGDTVKSEYVAGYEIAANTFGEDTVITAIQNQDATEYQVTFVDVKNYTSGSYKYNQGFTAEHIDAAEGKKFSHWERDGKIVSYDDKYVFYVGNYDTTVKAIFVDEADVVAKDAKITMAQPTIVAGNKISFIMERSVPEGFAVIEAGILIKKDLQTEITLDTAGIIKGTSVNHANYGAYNLRKANVASGDTWSAVGYLIYKDADGNVKTIYSDVVSKTL